MVAVTTYDVAIIGGGVVGLSTLRAASLAGLRCVLLEAKPHILDSASGRNSGIACTGVDAPIGSLERALIRDSISGLRGYLQEYNIPHRDCGSLVCLWPWDVDVDADTASEDALKKVAHESWNAGDAACRIHTAEEVLSMEPSLAPHIMGGVHIPGEIVLDPFLLPLSYAVHARENGAVIYTNFAVDTKNCCLEGGVWTLPRLLVNNEGDDNESDITPIVMAKSVVNAAGIFADLTQNEVPDEADGNLPQASFTSMPRRGQYCVLSMRKARMLDDSKQQLLVRPIQPIPTQRTKGVFVFSSMYDQLIIGPTALDQLSRVDDDPDSIVSSDLKELAARVIPSIGDPDSVYVGEWVGLRPATNHRDYQIHLYPERRWITAAGIRSTGLTASLGIGRYVLRLLKSIQAYPDDVSSAQQGSGHHTSPLPPVEVLVEQYCTSKDSCVEVNGFKYKVTHPITRFGWAEMYQTRESHAS